MSKHKAPSQVTIASTAEETGLHLFVQAYWKVGVGLMVLVAGGILFSKYSNQQSEAAMTASWARFGEEVSLGTSAFAQIQSPDAPTLERLAEELGEGPAAVWAKAFEIRALIDASDQEGATQAIQDLESQWGDHPLVANKFVFEEDGSPTTLPDHLRQRMHAVLAWEEAHPALFSNPPPAEGAPRVKLNTSAGTIEVALYTDQAPKHCENFLKLCKEGFYDGTAFHRVIRDFMIQGGDPNSKEGEPDTWGQGGPGYTMPQELSDLRHFRLVLAMAKKDNEVESSGSQFYITTSSPHHLDPVHTVFGTVVSGEDAVLAIESGALEGDRPQNPVVIESTEVIEGS